MNNGVFILFYGLDKNNRIYKVFKGDSGILRVFYFYCNNNRKTSIPHVISLIYSCLHTVPYKTDIKFIIA